ncbi:pyrroline-5-carboxylate reductase 3 isoform X1 [Haplochromis burtoni]|uniref:pyrroline-5-carboxylate reductase 3 isoform X1 n=1 Tax=Haplochromis burtoni TaxID=8153 RepID=UPI0006C9D6D3|nr:pyrroline-5-carboxylate reductase 3 isoform X1 [Haplochromis burtoni]
MDDSGIKKQNWDVKETELFLEILKELDMKKCLDGRKVRNNKLFKVAHRRMTAAGYHRSVDQLKFRWKLLKSAYYKCKREPDSPAPNKIQGWWRYEKTMVAIMESRHPLVGPGVNSDRNDEVTEESDGEASVLHWPQPCPDNTTQNLDLIGNQAVAAFYWRREGNLITDHLSTRIYHICIKMDPEMDSQLKIGFIGAGNMAFGIAKGILSGNVLPANVKVSAPSSRNLGRFQELGIAVTHSNIEVVCGSDVVFVAVKPHLVPLVLKEVTQHVTGRHMIVSVAAGVTLATLEELLPENSVAIRLMPNLPCLVQEGALLFARGSHAKQEDGALLRSLLHRCGLVEEGPEAWIDIHTGLSGSGVAFVYLFAEALAEGAVKMGMPSALAHSIASQTVLGAGRLLRDSGKHPAQLRSEVCTPGGTTIYGLHTLEQGGVRASTMSAVESATERARELGRKSTAGSRK